MSGSLGNEEFKDQYGLKLVMNKLNDIIGDKITDLNIVQESNSISASKVQTRIPSAKCNKKQ